MSEQHFQLVPESSQGREENDEKCEAATDFPEIMFGPGSVNDAGEVHAVVGGEEGEGQEDDRHDGEDEDGFVLAVRDDGQFILFDRAELEKLGTMERQ